MKRIAFALPLLLLATPAVAMTKQEKMLYWYAYNYGWLANTCSQYILGDITANDFKKDARGTRDNTDLPPKVWRAIVKAFNKKVDGKDYLKPCARIINTLDSDLL